MSIRDLFRRDKPHPYANTWALNIERNDVGRGDLYRLVHIEWDKDGNRTETILRPAPDPYDSMELWS